MQVKDLDIGTKFQVIGLKQVYTLSKLGEEWVVCHIEESSAPFYIIKSTPIIIKEENSGRFLETDTE